MNERNTNKSPFLTLGLPDEIYVNGRKIPRRKNDIAVSLLENFKKAVMAFTVARINGKVKLSVATYSDKERTELFGNKYGVDIENYCTRNACLDCEYFNPILLSDINRDCPLFAQKDKALEICYIDSALTLLYADF